MLENDLRFEDLLLAAQRGDESAWAALYSAYAPGLQGFFYSRHASEPEDLLGEVFVDLTRRLHAFSGSEKQFRSWVFMIAHNRLVDERRRLNRRPAFPAAQEVFEGRPDLQDVASVAVQNVRAEDALQLIDQLTPEQSAVLRMRLVEGLTVDEVATRLSKSPGAIKAIQRRGLAAVERASDGSRARGSDTIRREPSRRVGHVSPASNSSTSSGIFPNDLSARTSQYVSVGNKSNSAGRE